MKTNFACNLLFAAAGFVYSTILTGQTVEPDHFQLQETIIESVGTESEMPADYESILNDLELLRAHPIDLNTATAGDLQQLPFLTDFQVSSFMDYRTKNGRLLSIYELPMIYGFTEKLAAMMLPYVQVNDDGISAAYTPASISRKKEQEVILRTEHNFEKSAGYSTYDSLAGTNKYPGSTWLYYARYRLKISDHLQAGLTVENDPGEPFLNGSNRNGFDFNSAFIMVSNVGIIKSLFVGDFRLGFGQGLTIWSGTAPGKSSLPLNIVKRQDAVRTFTSADENDYLRGIAATLNLGRFQFTGFYSSKKRDANLTDTLENNRIYFSSFQESGYHRTPAELVDERSVRESAFGGNLVFRNNWIKVGSSVVQYYFDKYLEPGSGLEDVYDFSGRSLLNAGVDYSISVNKLQIFGETSYGNHYFATLNGALLYVNKYASFSFLYRNYSPGYFGLHSDALSESSANTNEEAFYAGMEIHPVSRIKVSAYVDFYRFPWLRYNLSAPASGNDFLLQTDYSPWKNVDMYIRFKYESKPENEYVDTLLLPVVRSVSHSNIRYHISYRLSDKLFLQDRVEITKAGSEGDSYSWGFMFYQDLEYRFKTIPVIVDFRLSLYDTDDYSSRIYAYEQDLQAGFSFSPLSDKGYRSYLMARYDINESINLIARFSRSHYMNKEVIGSGYDEIDHNTKNNLKVQLTVRF
jgi:hypothetical protein